MEPTAGRLALVLCAGAVLVAAMLAAAFVDAADDVTIGHVFSTQSGDNVDVEAVRDGADGACMHVSEFRYASATSCFGLETAADRGSYQVVIPTKAAVPPLVIGLLPSDAHGALVRVGGKAAEARTSERWFLAELEPGSLGPNNANPVDVEFDPQR